MHFYKFPQRLTDVFYYDCYTLLECLRSVCMDTKSVWKRFTCKCANDTVEIQSDCVISEGKYLTSLTTKVFNPLFMFM